MADYGFKYAFFGRDLNKKDPRDIGYSSEFGTLKTHKSGIVSVAITAGAFTTKEIPHGLTYRPAFNGYFRDPVSGEVYTIASGFETTGFGRIGTQVSVSMKSDNYNLIIRAYTYASDKNVDIFYEIFYEDLVSEPKFYFPF